MCEISPGEHLLKNNKSKKLISLTYNSTANRLLTKKDLEHILETSISRNNRERITGILLYMDGKFTQYFEGPVDGVIAVFSEIKSSNYHQDIINVDIQSISERIYNDWSMAFYADIFNDYSEVTKISYKKSEVKSNIPWHIAQLIKFPLQQNKA